MAQYKIRDPNALLQCPFDSTHMVRQSRMPYHIIDCKKNFPHLDYRQCPNNAQHWVPAAELKYHQTVLCPDRAILEQQILAAQYQDDGEYFSGNCSLPEYRDHHIKEPSGECWDSECDDSRPAFKWGEDNADEYFSQRGPNQQQQQQQQQPLRRPHGTSQVLQNVTNGNKEAAPQRLPKSLPLTHQPAAAKTLDGAGRGRGFGTLQQVAPSVGVAEPRQVAAPVVASQPQGIQQASMGPARRGRGRGYGKRDSSSEEDARSTTSSSSMSSFSSSSSSTREGQPRSVNTGLSFQVGNVKISSDEKPVAQQVKPTAPPYGLQGIGRGVMRSRMAANFNFGPAVGQVPSSNGSQSMEEDAKDESKKKIRKNLKKLREIEGLEEKMKQGGSLNSEEETKIAAKQTILSELEVLRAQMD